MEQSIISSDSHVIEVPDLWVKGMPAAFKDRAPKAFFDEKRDAWMFGSPEVQIQAVGGLFMAGQQPENLEKFRKAGFAVARPGGWDPLERQADMVTDGVAAEVLYPSLGLGLYCVEDAGLQEALFRAYNDWIIEYCQKVPDRLFGVALISMYNIDHAIAEMERCKKEGVVGTMIWQVPHPSLPFTSEHYERFWAASQDLDLPVHLHILTGFGDSMHRQTAHGLKRYPHRPRTDPRDRKRAVRIDLSRRARTPSQAEDRLGGKRSGLDAVLAGPVRQRLQTPSPLGKSPDEQVAERILCRADLRDFFQRPGRRQDVFLVGRRQLHVVQRLSASEFDLAEFPRGDRPRHGAFAGRDAREVAQYQRAQAL